MAAYKDILYQVDDNVATIAINRPKRLNAFTGDTIVEFEAAIEHAGADRKVGAIILTGVGERAFSSDGDVEWEAGGDLEEMRIK